LTRATGQTGAVTLIQRFGSALDHGRPSFQRVPPPTPAELDAILTAITARIARHLERLCRYITRPCGVIDSRPTATTRRAGSPGHWASEMQTVSGGGVDLHPKFTHLAE
jgi:hypothetical protein